MKAEAGRRNLEGLRGLTDLSSLTNASQEDKVIKLSCEQILVLPQVRRVFKGIEDLAENFKHEGQQTPIIVSPLNKDTGKYELQKGERRFRAAQLIPGFELKAIVDSRQRPKSVRHASQLTENLLRDGLLPHEVGQALYVIKHERLAEGLKATGRELSQLLNVSESFISTHLGLADIPEDLALLIDDGVTSDTDVIYSLKLISDLSPILYKELLAQARAAEDGGISRAVVREALKVAKGQVKPIPLGGERVNGQPTLETPTGAGNQKGQLSTDSDSGQDGHNQTGETTLPSANISHAKTIEQQSNTESGDSGSAPLVDAEAGKGTDPSPMKGATPPPKAKAAAKGKLDVFQIDPTELVVGVTVATDKSYLKGELLLDRVMEDPSKAWVNVIEGGKQQLRLVSVDTIQIVSMVRLASCD